MVAASHQNDVNFVNLLLLRHGGDSNRLNRDGDSPLTGAVGAASGPTPIPETVTLLLNNRADINRRDGHCNPPLYYALETNRDLVQYLLENGANPNVEIGDGRRIVLDIANQGRIRPYSHLLERYAHIKSN